MKNNLIGAIVIFNEDKLGVIVEQYHSRDNIARIIICPLEKGQNHYIRNKENKIVNIEYPQLTKIISLPPLHPVIKMNYLIQEK